jgi:carbamoyl-phosphate synthase large subunit
MVQRYVGTGNDEYTVGVLTSFEGELLGSIALRRRLTGALSTHSRLKNYSRDSEPLVISTGISQGVIDDFPEVRRYAETVALALGSRGPINVQCRLTEEGMRVFEINPRFSGTESLRALAGYNAPDTLVRKYVLGEDIAPMHYERGLALRGLDNRFMKSETFDRV